ncbi:ferredoxin [Gordonia sp. CPCC 205515]|uniref:ferredoxin n=1 Tax=Gordonia sp. CPCC 205515 TaxID=3140791 RepID=UPI003AF3F2BC
MRIQADQSKCQGHGLCRMSASDVYDTDDEGQVVVRFEGDIPEALEDDAVLGVESCPEVALTAID